MYLRFKAHRYIIKETVSFSWNLGIQCPEWRYPPNRIRGTVPPEWRFKNARNTHAVQTDGWIERIGTETDATVAEAYTGGLDMPAYFCY